MKKIKIYKYNIIPFEKSAFYHTYFIYRKNIIIYNTNNLYIYVKN